MRSSQTDLMGISWDFCEANVDYVKSTVLKGILCSRQRDVPPVVRATKDKILPPLCSTDDRTFSYFCGFRNDRENVYLHICIQISLSDNDN